MNHPQGALYDQASISAASGGWQLPSRLLRQDLTLMRRLARWHVPRWVRIWMLIASRGGNGYLWIAVGVGVLVFGGPPRYAAFGSALLAVLLGVGCFVALKTWVRRPRPETAAVAGGEHRSRLWRRLAPSYEDEYSFPSGHSLTGFAVATSLWLFYPDLGMCLLFCAGSIAASRLVLGLHFLSDVVAGCMLGSALGFASVLLLVH